MRGIESNIWKLYAIRALRSFMLIMPVIVVFFQANGLSMREVFVLQALFSLVVLVLEVPTGYCADIWSRKFCLVIGGATSTLGFGIYALSHDFWGFLLAEVILGIGASLVSGADSALLYDSLLEAGREKEYKKLEGRNYGWSMSSEALASILGGLLAAASLRLPIVLNVATMFLILPLALTLKEPACQKSQDGSGYPEVWRLCRHVLIEHQELKLLILFSALVSASTLTMVWFTQPYQLAIRIPLEAFGGVWAGLLFAATLVSWHAHAIEKRLGRKRALAALWALPLAGYCLAGITGSWWGVLWLLLFSLTRGLLNPVLSDYVNRLVASEVRATVLSIKNLVSRLIFAIVGPFAGWASDTWTLSAALWCSGMVYGALGGGTLLLMRQRGII